MTETIDFMVAEIPALQRYGQALAGTRASAEDLVQDTLERAIHKFHLYQQGTNLRLWLFTIMRNLFRDQYRRQRKSREIASEIGHAAADSAPPDQLDRLINAEMLAELNGLKKEYRDVLMMVGDQGLSYDQAAEAAGVPLGTIRSRLFRARTLLAERITAQSGGAVHSFS